MLTTFIDIVHLFVCAMLMFVVLLQQGRGGGMGAALGGGASQQVFGGSGAGNLLTRATGAFAAIFMITSVSLAYLSSSGDRALKAKAAIEEAKHGENTARPREKAEDKPKPTEAPADKPADKPAGTNESPTPPETPSPQETPPK